MRAEYLVTVPPGAYVLGVGFVEAGHIFTAPADDYVPSRTCRAMNPEAAVALQKLQESLKSDSKKWAEKAKTSPTPTKAEAALARSEQLAQLAEDMVTHVVTLSKPEPAVRPGLTLKELGEQAGFQVKSKRAADR